MYRAGRIVPSETAFAIDRPFRSKESRRDRAQGHLKFIRRLPCLICGARRDVQAAHLRMASREHGKRHTGLSEKSDDRWTLPLCVRHHVLGPQSQHASGEASFWQKHHIDPFLVCLALWSCSGNEDTAEIVISEAREKVRLSLESST